MIDIIKEIFKKINLPISIIYISIALFFTCLCSYEHNTYVVDFLTVKLFSSYENLYFVNFFLKNLILIFCIIYIILIILNSLINYLSLKPTVFKMQSIMLYVSAFKLFTYFLMNYKLSPDENINILLDSSRLIVIGLLLATIFFGIIEQQLNKI